MLASILLIATSSTGCNDTEYLPAPLNSVDMSESEPDPDPKPDPGPAPADQAPTIAGFSWVSPQLAGLPKPGNRGDLSRDLTFLADEGVDVLVSLTVTPISETEVRDHGMVPEHIPIVDFTAPTPEQLDTFMELVDNAHAEDTKVAVHCLGGMGRTGTMLAAWFIHGGMTAEEALTEIRTLRPGSVETADQELALEVYAQRVHGSEEPEK